MSGLFGGTSAQQSPILKGLRAQTSLYGGVIPIIYGRQRIPGNVIDYRDFVAIKQKSQGGKGGLFGGGGKGGGQQYTYTAATLVGICQGPITNLYNVYDTTAQLTLTTVTESFTIPGGGGSHSVTHASAFYDNLGVTLGTAYSVGPFTDYGSPGPVTLSGTQQIPMIPVVSGPTTGQYVVTTAGLYTFSAADGTKTVQITYSYATPQADGTNGQPITRAQLTLFNGTFGQAAWSYMTTNHSAQALGYNLLAYVANAKMNLGPSGAMPNLSYEITGLLPFGGGIVDSNPRDVIYDLLTNSQYGLAFPAAEIGDFTTFSNYCVANGLFISPIFDSSQPANDWLKDILDGTNSEAVFSSGLLKIVPYGDTTVVGNGATFSPPTTPVYDFNDDDFIYESGTDPVVITRPTIADVYNNVQVEFLNRVNQYNPEIVEEKDQNAIEVYRPRQTSPRSMHFFTVQGPAQLAANTLLKRQVYIRNLYKFKVDRRYILVDPMDLVTITDANLGLSKYPVRVTNISESSDGKLEMEAEQFPWGTAQPTANPKQSGTPYLPTSSADPGNVNAPVMFEAVSRMNDQIGHAIWMGLSGSSPNWGGCTIWMSTDNATFAAVGKMYAPSRTGLLTATLASHADPDTTNTLSVDLTESSGALASGSAADCDNYRTLCFVDGELISYQTATLTSSFHYNLTTRLRRGVFGSTIAAHSSGTKFLRIDQNVFTFDYDPTLIGTTVYFKFTSFNELGMNEQLLSGVSSISFAITGSSLGLLTPAHVTYRPTTNPLTAQDAGSNVTVNIASFAMRIPGIPDISVNSGAITALPYSTIYYIYYDDPGFTGGAVTFQAATAKEGALNAAGRFFIGSIFTPAQGGVPTVGNNDGGAAAQSGDDTRYSYTTVNSSLNFTNPSNATDGNPTTFASATVAFNGSAAQLILKTTAVTPIGQNCKALFIEVDYSIPANTLSPSIGSPFWGLFQINAPRGTAFQTPFPLTTVAKTTISFQIFPVVDPNIDAWTPLNLLPVDILLDNGAVSGGPTSGSLTINIYEVRVRMVQ